VSHSCSATLPIRALLVAALAATLGGCTTQIVLPVAPQPDVAPVPSTPTAALARLSWSWKHRALEPCRDLFTCDYEFVFAPGDTNGARFQERPWTRPDELDFARHLFETGSATAPAASYVALDLESDPPLLADDRPGKDPGWHRRIDTPFVAVVEAPGRQLRVLGFETFYFVRGDSACIPQELRDRGYEPDSTRWWIDHWEEYIVAALAPSAATSSRPPPLRPITLGAVKAMYLDAPPAP
jgi:hypothetical protein